MQVRSQCLSLQVNSSLKPRPPKAVRMRGFMLDPLNHAAMIWAGVINISYLNCISALCPSPTRAPHLPGDVRHTFALPIIWMHQWHWRTNLDLNMNEIIHSCKLQRFRAKVSVGLNQRFLNSQVLVRAEIIWLTQDKNTYMVWNISIGGGPRGAKPSHVFTT